MKKLLKFMIPVFFLLIVIIGFNAYFGSLTRTRAGEPLEVSGLGYLELDEGEAKELGLSYEEAQDACTVYRALLGAEIFSADEYAVAYLTDGGAPDPNNTIVEAGSKLKKPTDPVKDGYTFVHWEYELHCDSQLYVWDFDTDVVGFNVVLSAVYEKKLQDDYYLVEFNTDGGTPVLDSQKIKPGQKISKPIEPIKEGHTFLGWFCNAEIWDFENDVVMNDMTLTAKYDYYLIENEFAVTFDADGGSPTPPIQKVRNGRTATKPEEPSKDGYIFGGWYKDDYEWDFDNNVIASNITLKAKWTKASVDKVFDVKFDTDGGNPIALTQKIKDGEKVTRPTEPSKDGYIFEGWYENDKLWDFDNDVVITDMTLKAKWTKALVDKIFNVKFDTDGGSPITLTQKAKAGDKVTRPTEPSKDGYIFEGWYENDKLWDFDNDVVITDITLTAKWTEDFTDKIFDVIFDTDGGSPITFTQKIKAGDKVTRPTEPSKDGYIFEGWYENDKLWDFDNDVVITDITLTSKWTEDFTDKIFDVIFDTDDGSPIPSMQKIKNGEGVTRPTEPSKDGYIFKGWYEDDRIWSFDNDVVTSDIILKAKWIEDLTDKMFDVTFNTDGGVPISEAQRVRYGTKLVEPAPPTKAGYTFIYWVYINDNGQDVSWNFSVDVVSSDINFIARYIDNPTEYTISFDTDGGLPTPAPQIVTEGGRVVEPLVKPAKNGYVFTGWIYNNSNWDFANNTVNSDMELKASYEIEPSVQEYKVTFDSMGGTHIGSQTVNHNGEIVKPADPFRVGYEFVYWYILDSLNNETEWDFRTDKVTGDITLYAKYRGVNKEYIVRFNANGGIPVPENQLVTQDQRAIRPADPVRQGYIFEYWYLTGDDSAAWDFENDFVSSDIELVAKYKDEREGKEYCAEFYTDGGAPIPETQTLKFGERIARPTDPYKEDYVFECWTYFDEYGREAIWNFDIDTIQANTPLVARYIEDSSNIYFNAYFYADGGLPSPNSQRLKEGSLVGKPNNPKKEGFEFIGWYMGQELWDFNTDVLTEDIILVAKYEAKSSEEVTVTFDADGGIFDGQSQAVKIGSRLEKPVDPQKDGLIFNCWYYIDDNGNSVTWNFDTDVVSGKLLLIAKYDIKNLEYTEVIFNVNGGSPETPSQILVEGSKITEPIKPIRDGYSFIGWYYHNGNDEVIWDFENDAVNSDLILNARYQAIYVPVTFDADGGSTTPSIQYVSPQGGYVKKPVDPIRDGYVLVGWYCQDNGQEKLWSFDTDRLYNEDSLALTAKWKSVKENIKITWYDSLRATYTYTYIESGQSIKRIVDPQDKDDYRFFRWNCNGFEWDFNKLVYKDMTLISQHVPISKYWFMQHDSNGGLFVPQMLVYKNSNYRVPKIPTWAGSDSKTFTGWECEDKIVVNITATGDLFFKATWK